MKIKKVIKKIVSPFIQVAKRILKPFTSRFRNWSTGIVREAVGTHLTHLSENINRLDFNLVQSTRLNGTHQEIFGNLEAFLLSFLIKQNSGQANSNIPFGIPINQELVYVKHPILKYFFASSTDVIRLSQLLLESYQISVSQFLLDYKKNGVTVLDLDPYDGYHTLSIVSNIGQDSTVYVSNSSIAELNFQLHALNQRLQTLDQHLSREDRLRKVFAQTNLNLVILNHHQSLVDDLRVILSISPPTSPTILFEYSPGEVSRVDKLIKDLRLKYPDYRLFQLNRFGSLIPSQELSTLTGVSHLVLTQAEVS